MGCFVLDDENSMGCYVWGDKNSMGCFVRGDKNSMGCFVRGGKSLWDVLSRVAKNGMGCFVPGCFVWLPNRLHVDNDNQIKLKTDLSVSSNYICNIYSKVNVDTHILMTISLLPFY